MKSFTTSFTVDRTPKETFDAINNVRSWWTGEIEGETAVANGQFTYRYKDNHRSRQQITEFIAGKRIVWHVLESELSFVEDKSEWNGTDIIFEVAGKEGKTEVRFTHAGLVPEYECFGSCSSAWGMLINGNLRRLIETGEVQPDPFVPAEALAQ
jgi:hypothetical protein